MMSPSSRRDFLKNMMLLAGAAQIGDARLLSAAAATPARHYVNIAPQAGIHFTHNNGAFGKKFLPETMGSGCAFIDYDNDGNQDILLINGTDFPGYVRRQTTMKLYHNNGNGTFTDVTARAGLNIPMYGMGVAIGDYDNDGWDDIYVTGLGEARLFHNEHNGRFRDVTKDAGVNNPAFGASAAWVDYDKDGKLDLFVCNYVEWTEKTDIYCSLDGQHKSYCTPGAYKGQSCRLFHNLGGGRFEDVTKKAGIYDPTGKNLGVAVVDYDMDGWPDLAVSNDTEPNKLYHNSSGEFIGGTNSPSTASGFTFFINSIVRPDAYDPDTECAKDGSDLKAVCIYPPPFLTGELLSYGDAGTPGNVSDPMVVGFSDWQEFKFLFGGRNSAGQDRIYAVNQNGQLLSYEDAGTPGNVSDPMVVGFGGWSAFKFLFGGRNANGQDRIYAVNQNGELLSYGDVGTPGNVSDPMVVGFSDWQDFKFLFGGRNSAGQDRIYAVNQNGQLLSYEDAGTPGNVSDPMVVGFGGWQGFKFLFGGRNAAGQDRIYAVNQNGELLSYGDAGTPGNVSDPMVVGFSAWLDFKFLFGGRNVTGQDRIYAVVP